MVGPVGAGTDLTYAPDPDFCNDPPPFDTFTYTVNGGDTATVRLTVTCVNDAPTAIDDDRTTPEDTPFDDPVTGAGSPAANDNDADGDTLTVTAVSNPVGGTVAIASGQITFTPTANLCGNNAGSYDYTVSDGNSGTDTGTVTIDLTCVDDAPVANDDSRTVAEDSGATTFNTLRSNDTDVESDPITITAASDPANGVDHVHRNGRDVHPGPGVLQRPGCGPGRHVHLHRQRWRHRDRFGDGDLRAGRSGARHERGRRALLLRGRPTDPGGARAHPDRRGRGRDDHRCTPSRSAATTRGPRTCWRWAARTRPSPLCRSATPSR